MTAPTDTATPQDCPAVSGSDHRLVRHLDLFSGIVGKARIIRDAIRAYDSTGIIPSA